MDRVWIGLGAAAGLVAVAMAAVAAHAPVTAAQAQMLRDGVQMQGWHALALLGAGLFARTARGGRFWLRWAGLAFAAGMLLFCGDIYLLVFAGVHLAVAPAGGLLLMGGWALLGIAALRDR
jgi:uncharacterized membrane protein YgdD (TMEM256/DUF423 family)